MKQKNNKKTLGELISRAVGRKNLKFDFGKWKAQHQKEIQDFQVQIKHSGINNPSLTNIWRIIMKSPVTKLAAAAVIIAAGALSINLWDKSIPTAYALEQTIEANHSIRYLHIKDFDPSHKEPKEFWVECDESGKLKSTRWHMPEWDAPEDGAKVVVWKEDKIQLWFKGTTERRSCLVIYTKIKGADWVYNLAQAHNPKLAVERLYEQQAQGKVKIEVHEPADKDKPITVTATYLSESPIEEFSDTHSTFNLAVQPAR